MEPIFKEVNKYINNNLPSHFQMLALNRNLRCSQYTSMRIPPTAMDVLKCVCDVYDIGFLINNREREINNKFHIHSLQGFARLKSITVRWVCHAVYYSKMVMRVADIGVVHVFTEWT